MSHDVPEVTVFADVVCPFAYIGLTRLLERRHQLGRDDVRLRVRAWPLELVNGRPVDGAFIAEEIDEVAPQVAPDLFGGFDPAKFPASSLPALALTAVAYERGPDKGERVAMEVRRRLFELGQDVGDPAVLRQIADEVGVAVPTDVEPALAEWRLGQELGVVGSPHFFVGGESVFCPVLDISRDAEHHLHVHVDRAAMEHLVALCFGEAGDGGH